MKKACEKIKERLGVEIESSDKYIREYDSSPVQIAWNKGMRKCLEIVSEVEAEYGNGWIPCNRADHPYDGQRVLACINTRIATHEIIITDYNGEIYWFDGTISAWMPLPSPFKTTTD